MNLTSKRVIAGLLLAAAFTGVLLKELPWRDDAAKPGVPGLGSSESELGQTQVLVQGETQTDVIDTTLPAEPAEKHKQEIPFAGVPNGNGKAFDSGSKADVPMAGANAELPDPIATIAGKSAPVDSPAAFAPFLAQNNPTPPISGGGSGGGNGGGGNGGGGAGGGGGGSGGNPGGGNSGGNPGGGQTPQNPTDNPSDNPPGHSDNPSNPPGDNPPSDNPPGKPGDDVSSNPPPTGDNPKDPFVPQEPTIDYPKNPDDPTTPTFPPEDPLVPPGGPTTDLPNDPTDTPTHSVPDTGSSLGLLMLALSGLALASRKRSRAAN